MDYGKPAHAELLLRDLESATDVRAALLRHVQLLPSDSTLMNAYIHLTFSPEASDFLTVPTRNQALSAIAKEYEIRASPDAIDLKETDLELRQNLARTYYDLGLGPLASLPDFDPAPEYYLTDLWGHATPKTEAVSTPKGHLLRSASTLPSQHATPSSWMSNVESETDCGVRGLKRLSSMVKSVVSAKSSIPHKEVVFRVLQEVRRSAGGLKEKEEKNIKRRLYDAINVLLAVGVLAKEGRCLLWKGEQRVKRPRVDLQSRSEKESQLRLLVSKYLSVKWLLHRNSSAHLPCGIQFPFIIFATPDTPENSISIYANQSVTKLKLGFAHEIKSMGDLDVLMQLSADFIDRQTALSFLPHRDLIKFASLE